jgi:hypothetical protein
MAQQKGVLKIKGKIDDLSFYQSQDGHMVRMKGGIDGKRIASDASFVRTRENMAEFASSASAGKTMRLALFSLIQNARDNRVSSRLTKIMSEIKNMDATSARGLRNVGVAIALPAAKFKLKGFNFNNRALLQSILFNAYSVNTATGVINVPGLIPIDEVAYPQGATHVSLRGCWARINFATGVSQVFTSNVVNLPINSTSTNVTLTPTGTPTGAGTDLFILQIEFFQMVNNVQYVLKNGANNTMAVIEVA